MEGQQEVKERSGSTTDQSTENQVRTNVSDNQSDTTSTQNGVLDTNKNVPKQMDPINTKSPEGISNMAFTVDFGNDENKSMDGKSLSDFVPSKIRKSFRERKEKTLEKASEKQKLASKDKIPQENPVPTKPSVKEKTGLEKTSATVGFVICVSSSQRFLHFHLHVFAFLAYLLMQIIEFTV